MAHYSFRTITPDGRTVFETTSAAKSLREAIAFGFSTACEVKSRQLDEVSCDTWFIDILDSAGCWLMSVPFAMVSRKPEAHGGCHDAHQTFCPSAARPCLCRAGSARKAGHG